MAANELTVGSLFSGIGGLDLGLERAGMRVIWQSEIDPYACKVLRKHWPEVVNYGDIKEIKWEKIKRPDVICGGYPCQPFSTAGKRRGEEDPRHLWPWVREAISQLRPRYAILENVRGHLSMGGLSVIGELANIGYDAEWRVVSAASVGANHRRDRIIIVAYPNSTSRQQQCEREIQQPDIGRCGENVANAQSIESNERQSKNNSTQSGEQRLQGKVGAGGADVANANSIGLEGSGAEQQTARTFGSSKVANAEGSNGRNKKSHNLQTVYGQTAKLGEQDCIGRTIGNWWQIEPDVGRVANGVSSRVDRLKGLGNSVVPQVAEVIGRLVVAHANQ